MEALVALVLAITQVLKSWVKTWFKIPDEQWRPWMSVTLSFLTSVGVVLYRTSQTGAAITLNTLGSVLAVFALANGAKKIISKVKR